MGVEALEIQILPPPSEQKLLGEEILYRDGSFRRVRSYFEGWHPELNGELISNGWQGKETRVEHDVLKPVGTFSPNGHKP